MSKPAYVQEFDFGGKRLTSIVMDEDEFEKLVDELKEKWPREAATVEGCRAAKHIPAIGRGTVTGFIFDRYNVKTDVISIIVRGMGPEVARRFGIGD